MRTIAFISALVLGVIMLFLDVDGPASYSLPDELSHSQTEKALISPEMLSDSIIRGYGDMVVIDIRIGTEFEQESIRGAVNIPLSELLKKATIRKIPSNKTIVLYDKDGSVAARASHLLRRLGYNAWSLDGGYFNWNNTVLNPVPPLEADSDEAGSRFRTLVSTANYYKGNLGAVSVALPERKAGGPAKAFSFGSGGQSVKEGC